jgi:hypothetical protein
MMVPKFANSDPGPGRYRSRFCINLAYVEIFKRVGWVTKTPQRTQSLHKVQFLDCSISIFRISDINLKFCPETSANS